MNKEELYKKIDAYVDEHTDDIAQTLSQLVRCNSLNPGEPGTADESEVQAYIAGKYAELGMEVTSKDEGDPKRPNVTGRMVGSGNGSDLILNGHADVVPPGDVSKWTYPPFEGVITDGKVYGRGAVDCKSGLCNTYWAMKTIHDLGIKTKGDCYCISSVGEESQEGETIGAFATVNGKKFNNPFVVVAEGTGFEIYSMSSGLLYFDIKIKGKSLHIGRRNLVSYPQNYGIECGPKVGVDALQKAIPFIEYFYRLQDEWNFRFRDPVLNGGGYPRANKSGVGVFTITPVDIKGGVYLGSVMDEVTIRYGCWHPEYVDREMIIQEIKDAVAALASTDMWLRENPPELTIPGPPQEWRGFQTDVSHPGIATLIKATKDTLGEEAIISGHRAVSDASWFSRAGLPVVVYGSSHSTCFVHGVDENAIIENLVKAVKVYAHMIVDWCGVAE